MGSNTVSHSGAGNKQPSLAELHPGKMNTDSAYSLSLYEGGGSVESEGMDLVSFI